MFTVILMSFQKKDNSTKQPTGGGLAVQGTLKEPCSIMNPTISIERLSGDASPSSYTYAYINKFGRYYFITDWRWVDGLWEVDMRVDVLASFKTEIGASSQYILRHASSTDYNEYVTDTMYPATTEFETQEYAMTNIFSDNISVGCYVLGCISGAGTASVGAITYYVMTSSQFNSLKNILLSDENFETMDILDTSTTPPTWKLDDMSKELLKTMYNPFQYIVSCMWFPFPASQVSTSASQKIKLGWWEYNVTASIVYAQRITFAESGPFPTHPQYLTRGEYLNHAPYTKITLHGRFGSVALDTAFFTVGDSIYVDYTVDFISGHCHCVINQRRGSYQKILAQRDFLLGVPIQLAQVGIDYLGAGVTAINSVGNTVSSAIKGFTMGGIGGAVAGAVAGVANGIYNTLDASMPQMETGGANGSFNSPAILTHVTAVFYKIVDENLSHKGRPLCEERTINSLSGFIMCAEGDLDISCFEEERKRIANYLVSGFYWE